MRFALAGDIKVEASPQLKAVCPGCNEPVIAKCGEKRIHHWAHRSKHCDPWWEPETEWHRSWKNKFSVEWQESCLRDEKTGELHIADIRTIDNMVIEFQHSHIDPKEQRSRERFYKNMVWVVDGTRLKRDYPRFLKGKNNGFENTIFYNTDNPKIFRVDLIDWCLPSVWLECTVPVIFDFLGVGLKDNSPEREPLYCLFPQRVSGRYSCIAEISRSAFIKSIISGEWSDRVGKLMSELEREKQLSAAREKAKRELQGQANRLAFNRALFARRRRRRF